MMNDSVVNAILLICLILIGSINISQAIKCFKDKIYFLFGLNIFGAILMVFNMFRILFDR